MKKLFVLALLGLVAVGGCKKEKLADEPKDSPIGWSMTFRLIHKSGELVFPDPPPTFITHPFNPSESYHLTGEGTKYDFGFFGNDSTGLIFGMGKTKIELLRDSNYMLHDKFVWKVYLNPNHDPILFEVHHPDLVQGYGAQLILWDNDTLFYSTNGVSRGADYFKVIYR